MRNLLWISLIGAALAAAPCGFAHDYFATQSREYALTGTTVSPGIFDVLMAMGRDLAFARIDDAIATLRADAAG